MENGGEIYVGIVTIRFVGPALLRNTALSHSLTTVMEARTTRLPLLRSRHKTRFFLQFNDPTDGCVRIHVIRATVRREKDRGARRGEKKKEKHYPEKRGVCSRPTSLVSRGPFLYFTARGYRCSMEGKNVLQSYSEFTRQQKMPPARCSKGNKVRNVPGKWKFISRSR